MITMKAHVSLALGFLTTIASIAASQDARQILEATGVQGGLVVVIGYDSPELLAELQAGGSYVVHGLDRDSKRVAAARSHLREKGLYGPVTVAQWGGAHLPYVDSLVNLGVGDPNVVTTGPATINPATGESFATTRAWSGDAVEQALVHTARQAKLWAQSPHAERRALLEAVRMSVHGSLLAQ